MKEIIKSIRNYELGDLPNLKTLLACKPNIKIYEINRMGGFIITTNRQNIFLLMNYEQNCCENFGYFLSEDDIRDFIGTELLSIKQTDIALKTKELPKDSIELSTLFITLETSIGPLQFVAYNEHNGNYGHDVLIVSKQFTNKDCL